MEVLRRFWSTDRSLTALLLFLVILIFIVDPLGDLGIGGHLLIDLVFSLLLISGAGAVVRGVMPTLVVGGLVCASLMLRWARLSSSADWLEVSDAFSSALLCGLLAAIVLMQVFRDGPITAQRLQGAVAVYLLFGLAWAFTYKIIALRWPSAFVSAAGALDTKKDLSSSFVYFSFVTLTTVGYGDVTAVHPMARSLATAEALVGQLYPAILLARLVSMEARQGHPREGP